jgi:hypothetical protein
VEISERRRKGRRFREREGPSRFVGDVSCGFAGDDSCGDVKLGEILWEGAEVGESEPARPGSCCEKVSAVLRGTSMDAAAPGAFLGERGC